MSLKEDLEPGCWFLGRGSRLQGVALCLLLRVMLRKEAQLHGFHSHLCAAFSASLPHGTAAQCQPVKGHMWEIGSLPHPKNMMGTDPSSVIT